MIVENSDHAALVSAGRSCRILHELSREEREQIALVFGLSRQCQASVEALRCGLQMFCTKMSVPYGHAKICVAKQVSNIVEISSGDFQISSRTPSGGLNFGAQSLTAFRFLRYTSCLSLSSKRCLLAQALFAGTCRRRAPVAPHQLDC
jgi:hypothetical protein